MGTARSCYPNFLHSSLTLRCARQLTAAKSIVAQPSAADGNVVAKLLELLKMLNAGALSQAKFDAAKAKVLE